MTAATRQLSWRISARRHEDRTKFRKIPGEAGLWVLLLGDMVMFGVFFAVFNHQRSHSPEKYADASSSLNLVIGAINTLLLLTGSYLVVLGCRAARANRPASAARLFLLGFATGIGFIVNKAIEYTGMVRGGHVPSVNDFYMYYFVLTGIHLIHLIIGMGILLVMWSLCRKANPAHINILEGGASYWHLVDLLWVVLFPLLYVLR